MPEKTPLQLRDEAEADVPMIERFARLVVELERRMVQGHAPTPTLVTEFRNIYEEVGGLKKPASDAPPEDHVAYHADLAKLAGAPPMSPEAAQALLDKAAADELARAKAARAVDDAKEVLALKAEQDAKAAEHSAPQESPEPPPPDRVALTEAPPVPA